MILVSISTSCSKLESPDIAQEFRISVEPLLNNDGQRDWEMRSKDGCSVVSFTVDHPYTVKITAFILQFIFSTESSLQIFVLQWLIYLNTVKFKAFHYTDVHLNLVNFAAFRSIDVHPIKSNLKLFIVQMFNHT